MIVEVLKEIFTRDLNRLYHEIDLYKSEDALWKIQGHISNAAGNLCLHLIGNLNTYIGREIGHIGYVRNRELEFSATNVPKTILLQMVNATIEVVNTSLSKIDDHVLPTEYPVLVFDEKKSIGFLLIHLSTHLTYHLGQINYHRRMTDY